MSTEVTIPERKETGERLRFPSPQDATIAALRAEGQSLREIGRTAGMSQQTVMRRCQEQEQWIKDKQLQRTKEVLEQFGTSHPDAPKGSDGEPYTPLDARHIDAATPDSKTGAQSFGQMLIMAGMASKGGMRDVHVHGDVNSVTNVDARSIVVEETDAELRAAADALRKRLG